MTSGPTRFPATGVALSVALALAVIAALAVVVQRDHDRQRARAAGTDVGAVTCYSHSGRADTRLGGWPLPRPAAFVAARGDGPVGLLALNQAASLGATGGRELEELSRERFVAAARQVWEDTTAGIIVDARVYQFACPAGATDHLRTQAAARLGTTSPVSFSVPGVAGARGYAAAGANSGGLYEQVVAAAVGHLYLTVSVESASSRSGVYAATLARIQAARLVGPVPGAPRPPGPPPSAPLPAGADDAPLCPPATGAPSASTFDRLFVPDPAGMVPFPGTPAGSGPVTPSALADNAFDPTIAAAVNRAQGFAGGDIRLWYDPVNQATLNIEVLRFTCVAGASQYLAAQLPDVGIAGGRPFTAASIAGPGGSAGGDGGGAEAAGVAGPQPDRFGRYAQSIVALSGATYVNVTLFNPTPDTARVLALARAEYAALQSGGAAAGGEGA